MGRRPRNGRRPGRGALLVAAVVIGATAGCALPDAGTASSPAADGATRPAPQAVLADRRLALGVAEQLADPLAPGTVAVRPGPADERVALSRARLLDGTVTVVLRPSGDGGPGADPLRVELAAEFYDAAGVLVDRRQVDVRLGPAADHRAERVRLAGATELRRRIVSVFVQIRPAAGAAGASTGSTAAGTGAPASLEHRP